MGKKIIESMDQSKILVKKVEIVHVCQKKGRSQCIRIDNKVRGDI